VRALAPACLPPMQVSIIAEVKQLNARLREVNERLGISGELRLGLPLLLSVAWPRAASHHHLVPGHSHLHLMYVAACMASVQRGPAACCRAGGGCGDGGRGDAREAQPGGPGGKPAFIAVPNGFCSWMDECSTPLPTPPLRRWRRR
jgi:hypothetical protein